MTTATLKLTTGLHIGGGDDTMKIGGIDSPVLKREIFANKNSGETLFPEFDDSGNIKDENVEIMIEPYIAGSSLKGKIRSLLEKEFCLIDKQIELFKRGQIDDKELGVPIDSKFIKKINNEKLLEKKAKLIIKLFGESGANTKFFEKSEIKITRGIFRDSFITNKVRKAFLNEKIELFEAKYENVIDRVSGTTRSGGLRQIERVSAGVEFDFRIDIRKFSEDENLPLLETLILGMKLLEMDTLGGSGSRGYGRVEFEFIGELDLYSKSSEKLLEAIESKLNEAS